MCTVDLIKGHFSLVHQWFAMVMGDISRDLSMVCQWFLLTIAVKGFIKGISHNDYNANGDVNVLFFLGLNRSCVQS